MDCKSLKNQIIEGARNSWLCYPSRKGDQYVLTLDFVLPNNDCVEVMVSPREEGALVHDMGVSYAFLRTHNIDLDSSQQKKRLSRVRGIMKRFNTAYENGRISKTVDESNIWKGIVLVAESMKTVTSMVESRQARPDRNFSDRVYGYFVNLGARVDRNYDLEGYTKRNFFDLRLNGTDQTLVKTISAKQTSRVQSKIERAWYAFDDTSERGHQFKPGVIYDDTEEDRRQAWTREHFQMLRKREIPAYGFESNQDQLHELGESHQR